MKKIICLLFTQIVFISLLHCQINIISSAKLQKINKEFQKNDWFSYDFTKITDGDLWYTERCIVNNKDSEFVFIDTNSQIIKVNNKDLTMIDNNFEEIAFYKKNYPVKKSFSDKRSYDLYLDASVLRDNNINIYSPYWQKNPFGFVAKSIDTTINGIDYTLYKGKSQLKEMTIIATGEKYFEQYVFCYFYNKATKFIDKMEMNFIDTVNKGIDPNIYSHNSKKIVYEFSNFSTENKQAEIDSVFDFSNKKYATYNRCDDENHSLSFKLSSNQTMTDEVLNYPLISIDNDTTTIGSYDGFTLLYFWFYSCTSCKLWFEVVKKEKQDYGKTIFEQNGIRVICINSFASDINRLKQESLKYGIDGFSYSAVGLSKIMDIGRMPTEYLLSPDKKVLYFHNGSLHEEQYSEIFEIIKNYKQ